MGLFDTYDPTTYQGSQGGLLDRILASVAAAPTNAGPGFPALPSDAQASAPAAPQPQNAPIAVGDYQMPRIGSGFPGFPEHDPQTGDTVAPVMQQPAAQPAAPMPQTAAPVAAPSIGDNLMTGYQNMRHGGGLIGSIVAAATGQRNDPQAELRVQQQKQVQQLSAALTGAGIPQEKAQQLAMIHAIDKEAGKALIEKALGPPQAAPEYGWDSKTGKAVHLYTPEQKDNFSVIQTGENGLGGKTFQKMNKATGDMTPIATAPSDASAGLGDMSKTGAEYLATLPPDLAGRVKAMVEGRQPLPSSFALTKPYWQNLITAAQAYDPTFDATNWSGRVAGVKDFSAGKSSEMVRSANQTLHHVNALLDSADALHNGNYPSLNWAGNKLNEAKGGGEPGAFKINAHAVSEELSKVFKGSNLSDAEIHAWEENLSPNMSPAQQRAQIGKLSELLHGSLQALEEKRVASIGQVAADKAGPIIKPEGQKVLQRIDAWLKANGDNAAGAAGTAPTGVKWSVVQ
jgi:hypothetical protein